MINIAQSDLFKEITRRICGSLYIHEALHDVFKYLKHLIPLDGIFITVYEYEIKKARLIALAYDPGGLHVDELIPVSDSEWDKIRKWHVQSLFETTHWIRDHQNPINKEIFKIVSNLVPFVKDMDGKEYSSITCALKIRQTIIGNVTMAAYGAGHYNELHADLVREVNEPFAIALSNALRYMRLENNHRALQKEAIQSFSNTMIGADSGLREVYRLIEYVASTDSPVLMLGETGAGKEVVASEIHKLSHRSEGPFIKLNCGAIHESLIDSELFGHEKGAFTGAFERSPGKFERADNGTIFLDEIGELPAAAQVKLLRVIQSGEFERVGGSKMLKTNVRILAATHRNLAEMVKAGSFRSDLWYRLNVFPISIPPLRNRIQDIPAMVHYFIRIKSEEMNLEYRPEIETGEMERLMEYSWPGNVRELLNVVERALILSRGKPLKFLLPLDNEMSTCSIFRDSSDNVMKLDDLMVAHIKLVLERTKGKISGSGGAAELLGLHPNTLRSKMYKFGLL